MPPELFATGSWIPASFSNCLGSGCRSSGCRSSGCHRANCSSNFGATSFLSAFALFLGTAALVGTSPAYGQDDEAETRSGRINIVPGEEETEEPSLPANVSTQVRFSEPSGNGAIDAGETGRLIVSVQNQGRGEARGIDVWVAPGKPLPEGLTVGSSLPADYSARSAPPTAGARSVAQVRSLSSSGEKKVEIPLKASRSISDGEVELTARVTEANGFGPASGFRVQFPTRSFRPPRLALTDHAVGGSGMEDGKIETSEIVDVKMRVQNVGPGPAEGVSVRVRKGSQNVFFTASSKRRFDVGSLRPSGKRDLSVQVYANNRANAIPLVLEIGEERSEFETTDTLRLDLDRPEQDLRTVVAKANRGESASESINSSGGNAYGGLGVDVEQNIPSAPAKKDDAVAVVIGVQGYPSESVPDVEYARRDAQIMREYLTKTLGFREENILPRDPDGRMTYAELRTLIQQKLPSYVKEGTSEVFVYYSGHGAPSTGEEKRAYLVPSDTDPNFVSEANAYRMEHFYEDLARLDAKSLTVALDACFTGQAGSGNMMLRQASPLALSVENPIMASENATGFLAAGPKQVANWYPEKKHGMFTYFFLKGLKGEADLNSNRKVTVREMKRYLTDEREGLPYWSGRVHQREQTPQVVSQTPGRVLVRYGQTRTSDSQ